MVLKFGKNGVSTGSTLRLNNSTFVRRYCSESLISLHETIHNKTVDLKEATFLDSTTVCYSLNKRGRWKLPEMIEDKITSDLSSLDAKVSLFKLHKLHQKNNCVGYFTNKGRVKSVVPKKTKYLNRLSVVNINNKPFRNRRRKRQREHNPADQNETDNNVTNELTYHIIYPTSKTSAVTFTNPAKTDIDMRLNTFYRSWMTYSSKCKKWRRLERDLKDDTEHSFYDVIEAESYYDSDEQLDTHRPFLFSDCFESALNGTLNSRVKGRKRPLKKFQKRKTCSTLHFFETPDSEIDDAPHDYPEPTYSRPQTTDCVPVDVVIPNIESNPEHLKNRFGTKVTFSRCEPQTFIIDIADNVRDYLKRSEVFKRVFIKKLDLSVFLVCSMKSPIDSDHGLWEVRVNLSTKLTSIRIETIFENTALSIDDIISLTVHYVETIPVNCFYRKDFVPITKCPLEKFNTIDALSQLKTSNCLLDNLSKTAQGALSHVDQNDVLEEFEWIPSAKEDEACNICYTDTSAFTALRSCKHRFCNDCWKEHILNSFTFKSKVLCPHYDCDEVVDVATMIRLVNIRDIQRSEKKDLNIFVESSSTLKWCPNQFCERILDKCDLSQNSVILCHCGMFVCFECQEERHWPSSCDEYASYKNKLNAFGEDVLRHDFLDIPRCNIRGKPCPQCKHFIIKDKGCPSMICPCGCRFCWSCLTPWRDHGPHTNCYHQEDNDGTDLREFIHVDRKITGNPMRSKLYQRAVTFRKLRREKHIKLLRSKAMDIKCRVRKWISKHDVNYNDCELSSSQQLDELFSDILNVTMELNYLCEICLVILDTKAKLRKRVLPNLHYSLYRLESYSRILNAILIDTEHQGIKDTRKFLTQLISLRQTAKDFIYSTVTAIQNFRKCEAKQ